MKGGGLNKLHATIGIPELWEHTCLTKLANLVRILGCVLYDTTWGEQPDTINERDKTKASIAEIQPLENVPIKLGGEPSHTVLNDKKTKQRWGT